MIKKIFFLILFPIIAYSQSGEFRPSLITSPTFSWISSNDNSIETESNQLGIKLQLQGEYFLTDKFSLTAGTGLSLLQGGNLSYKQGGNLWSESKLSIPNSDSLPNGVSLGYKIKYWEFPMGFKMTTSSIGSFRYYAQLPEFILGIRLGAKGSISGNGVSTSDESIGSQILFLHVAWALGAGFEYELLSNLNLQVGVRYQQSITDVTDDSGKYFDGTKQNSKDKLNSIELRAGIIF